jgi:hypothetical protein
MPDKQSSVLVFTVPQKTGGGNGMIAGVSWPAKTLLANSPENMQHFSCFYDSSLRSQKYERGTACNRYRGAH